VAECNYRWDAPNDEVTALFVGLCCWEWVAWRLQQGLRSTRDSAGAAAALHDVGTLQAVAKWDIYRDLRHYIQVCKQQPDYMTALGDVNTCAVHTLFVRLVQQVVYTVKVVENVDLARQTIPAASPSFRKQALRLRWRGNPIRRGRLAVRRFKQKYFRARPPEVVFQTGHVWMRSR
jgi:hypothetical protein